MNQDKYVFSQLSTFLNRTQFNNYVCKCDGNRYVKHFTCWNLLLAMMFGQLSNRESLRDLIIALEAHQGKRYHLGLGRAHYQNHACISQSESGLQNLRRLCFLHDEESMRKTGY